MTQDAILAQLNGIFREVLDDDSVTLATVTTAEDVEGWDSLNNIQIILAIERHFKVRFKLGAIRDWANVGDMCAAIEALSRG